MKRILLLKMQKLTPVFLLVLAFAVSSTSQTNLFTVYTPGLAGLSSSQLEKYDKLSSQPYESIKIIQVGNLADVAAEGMISVEIDGEVCGTVHFVAQNVEYTSSTNYYWYGELEEKNSCECKLGDLSLTHTSDGIVGDLKIENRRYRIEDLGEGKQALGKIPSTYSTACGGAIAPPSGMSQHHMEAAAQERDGNCDIRVLVLGTPTAMSTVGNFPLLVNGAINKTNQILQNSKIFPFQTRLVLAGIESTAGYFIENMMTFDGALGSIAGNSSAISRRNINGADIVVLFVNPGVMTLDGTAGIAYLGGRWAVVRNFGADNGIVFAHEVGHLLSAHHELCTTLSPGTGCLTNSGPAHAHTFNSGKCSDKLRKTVLYSNTDGDVIPNYSNPEVIYDRAATGVPSTVDNASVIRSYACTAANHSLLFNDAFWVNIVGPPVGCRNETVYLYALSHGTGLNSQTYNWQKSSNGINYGATVSTNSYYDLTLPSTVDKVTFVKVTVTNTISGQSIVAYWKVKVVSDDLCDRSSVASQKSQGIVFPNPSDGLVNLTIPVLDPNGVMSISDSSGKPISVEKSRRFESQGLMFQVNMSLAPDGIYFYRYQSGDQLFSGKIFINR